jgi:putative tryptophan/tyrosine transport system substrate-binding protein
VEGDGEDVKPKVTVLTGNARLSALCFLGAVLLSQGFCAAMFLTLCSMLLAPCSSADAQQPASKVHRIGWIALYGFKLGRDVASFLDGLRERGYVEGRNVSIEYRSAEGRENQLPEIAAELVRLKVEAIVATQNAATHVARKTTTTIPIVFVYGDPVGDGIVASLARPGGNITGLSDFSLELSRKRLELLKEALPKITCVAVLYRAEPSNMVGQTHTRQLKEMQVAAQALGVQLRALEVQYPEPDFERLFQAAISQRANALLILPDLRVFIYRRRVSELAVKSRLPAMYPRSAYVEAGGLMSYGPSPDLYRRAAFYVDKILKGAKPADLPVEQPTKFELVINLKTAKEIGVTIQPEILMFADRIIK